MSFTNSKDRIKVIKEYIGEQNLTGCPQFMKQYMLEETPFYFLDQVNQYPNANLPHSVLLQLFLNLELGTLQKEDLTFLIDPIFPDPIYRSYFPYLNSKPFSPMRRRDVLKNMIIFSVVTNVNNGNISKIYEASQQSDRIAFVTTPKVDINNDLGTNTSIELFLPDNLKFPSNIVNIVENGRNVIKLHYNRISLEEVYTETRKVNPYTYFLDVLPLLEPDRHGRPRANTSELTYFARKFNIFLSENRDLGYQILRRSMTSVHFNRTVEVFTDATRGLASSSNNIVVDGNSVNLLTNDYRNTFLEIFRFTKVDQDHLKLQATSNNFFYTGEMTVPVISTMKKKRGIMDNSVIIPNKGRDFNHEFSYVATLVAHSDRDKIIPLPDPIYPIIQKKSFIDPKDIRDFDNFDNSYVDIQIYHEDIKNDTNPTVIDNHPGERNPDGSIRWRRFKLGLIYNGVLLQNLTTDFLRAAMSDGKGKHYAIRSVRLSGHINVMNSCFGSYPSSWTIRRLEFSYDYKGSIQDYAFSCDTNNQFKRELFIPTVIPFNAGLRGSYIFRGRKLNNVICFANYIAGAHTWTSDISDITADFNKIPPPEPGMSTEEEIYRFYLAHRSTLFDMTNANAPNKLKIIFNEYYNGLMPESIFVKFPSLELKQMGNSVANQISLSHVRNDITSFLNGMANPVAGRPINSFNAVYNIRNKFQSKFNLQGSEYYKAFYYFIQTMGDDYIGRLSLYLKLYKIPMTEFTFLGEGYDLPPIPVTPKSKYKSAYEWSVFDQHPNGSIYYQIYL